jgi:hypothetical protein
MAKFDQSKTWIEFALFFDLARPSDPFPCGELCKRALAQAAGQRRSQYEFS